MALTVMLWGCARVGAQSDVVPPTPQGASEPPAVTGDATPEAKPTIVVPTGEDQPVSSITPSTPSIRPDRSQIVGRVTDRKGKPIAKAVLAIVWGTAPYPERAYLTDPEGHYKIGVAPGQYKLAVNAVGFQSAQKAVSVMQGETVTLDFQLDAE